MTEIQNNNFNTDNLLREVNMVIQNGVTNILSDFLKKYKIYEETHKSVLNLPCVKSLVESDKFLNESVCSPYASSSSSSCSLFSDDEEDPNIFVGIKEMTKDLVTEEVKSYHEKIVNNFEFFTSSNNNIIQQLLTQIESLKDEIKELKGCMFVKRDIVDLTMYNEEDGNEDRVNVEKEIVSNVNVEDIFIKEEKENIILNIVSDSEESEEEEEVESEVEEESEEEEVEQQVEVEEVEQEQQVEEEEEPESEEEVEQQVEVEEEVEQQVEVEQEVEQQVEVEQEQQVEVVEVEEEEEEEEESVEEVEQQVEEEQVETEAEEEEEEEEFFEIEIDDTTYCTNNEENGFVYELSSEGDVGKKVGFLKNGEVTFYE